MDLENINLEKGQGIATLTLDRPDKLNALTPPMAEGAVKAIREINEDDEIKVLVLTGTGRAFCSGADLAPRAEAERPTRSVHSTPYNQFGQLFLAVRECPKPTIVAINGIAMGIGLSIPLGCDIRIASDKATFSLIFVKRGLIAGGGATFYLPRILGVSKAFELMWTGDVIDAREAERIGLVSKVVPHEQLMPAAMEMALRIAKGPSLAIELNKRAVYKGLEANNFVAQLGFEGWAQSVCAQSEDGKEGVKAFLEKREPQFKGR